jgi:hypothetical protein
MQIGKLMTGARESRVPRQIREDRIQFGERCALALQSTSRAHGIEARLSRKRREMQAVESRRAHPGGCRKRRQGSYSAKCKET